MLDSFITNKTMGNVFARANAQVSTLKQLNDDFLPVAPVQTKREIIQFSKTEANVIQHHSHNDTWAQTALLRNICEPIKCALFLHHYYFVALTCSGKLFRISTSNHDTVQLCPNEFVLNIEPTPERKNLYIILHDQVLTYRPSLNDLLLTYTGTCTNIYSGAESSFFATTDGYYVYGGNSAGQLATGYIQSFMGVIFSNNTLLNNYPIQELYIGGWHGYAKLDDDTFIGFGYNTV
jgi:hypothetical protein